MATKKDIKNEIKWNIINSLLAGGLVFFGTFADGNVTLEGVLIALGTSLVVCITKFKDYWNTTKPNNKGKSYFNFV